VASGPDLSTRTCPATGGRAGIRGVGVLAWQGGQRVHRLTGRQVGWVPGPAAERPGERVSGPEGAQGGPTPAEGVRRVRGAVRGSNERTPAPGARSFLAAGPGAGVRAGTGS
jgi:hypothetical protein